MIKETFNSDGQQLKKSKYKFKKNSSNTNKTNNYLSPQTIEIYKTRA